MKKENCISCSSPERLIRLEEVSFTGPKSVNACYDCVKDALKDNIRFTKARPIPADEYEIDEFFLENETAKILCIKHLKTTQKRPVSKSEEISSRLIQKILDEKIYGNDNYKKVISMTVARHLSRDFKDHLMIIGPTGTGKTMALELICQNYKIPLYSCNAAMLSPSGYKGNSIDEIGKGLLAAAGGDIQAASEGIVFLDEIDKGLLGTFGEEISYSLLKILENDYLQTPKGIIPTKNILFVLGGSFRKIYDENLDQLSTGKMRQKLTEVYRFNEELFGRISNFVVLKGFGEKEYQDILTNHLSMVIPDVLHFLKKRNSQLKLTTEFAQYASREAVAMGLGIRGLRTIIKEELMDVMYSPELALNKEIVLKTNAINPHQCKA